MRLSEADGRPVISRTSAEGVGSLRHVVVDVPSRSIRALHVAGGRRSAVLVDWDVITGFGPDGIVVAGDDAGRPPARGRPREGRRRREARPRRAPRVSDAGRSLGALEDVVFDESTGAVTVLVAGGEKHEAARLRAIGPYCVILACGDAPAPP